MSVLSHIDLKQERRMRINKISTMHITTAIIPPCTNQAQPEMSKLLFRFYHDSFLGSLSLLKILASGSNHHGHHRAGA